LIFSFLHKCNAVFSPLGGKLKRGFSPDLRNSPENRNFVPLKFLAMESTRQKKVSRLIQKELADIFIKRGNEFAHGKLVSITRVRLSPDLSFAKVYISIFPATNQDDVLHSIEEHTSKIRFELGQKVRTQLRIVPDIAFHIDDSLDYIDKIDKLLKS
jgi:ribosome-binding factor A